MVFEAARLDEVIDFYAFSCTAILFTETADCYHLQFDFFRNSWMVRHDQATVPVPMVRDFVGHIEERRYEIEEDED